MNHSLLTILHVQEVATSVLCEYGCGSGAPRLSLKCKAVAE
jgi:hypothetical protein